MLRMESGKHASMGEVEMVPCRSVKYEPLGDKKGLLTIDGEVADYEGFQADILPGHLRIAS